MKKDNAQKWQNVISKPQSHKRLKKPVFVKISAQAQQSAIDTVTLQCGKANLNIPVGADPLWLGTLLKALSSSRCSSTHPIFIYIVILSTFVCR